MGRIIIILPYYKALLFILLLDFLAAFWRTVTAAICTEYVLRDVSISSTL